MSKKFTLLIYLIFSLPIFSYHGETFIDGICKDGQGYIEFTIGEYFGGCKDKRTEHGTGTFTFYDTSLHMTWLEDDTIYEGEWSNTYMEGTGTLTWPDGRTYQGNFYQGVRHGLGYVTKPNGKGSFVLYEDNSPSRKRFIEIDLGNDTIRQFWNGDNGPQQYIGKRCSNGKRCGKGTYTWFLDNYQTKNVYEGDFLDGKRTGKGKYIWSNGDTYEGDWVDNKQHGFGIYTSPDGTSNPRLYNKGKLLDADGFCLEGNCERGRGKYINNKGELYEGKWAEGKRNGAGTLTNIFDNTSVKSVWENDVALCDFTKAKVIDGKLACNDATNSSASNNQKQIASNEKNSEQVYDFKKAENAIVFSDLHWEMSSEEIKEAVLVKSGGVCTEFGSIVSCFVDTFTDIILLNLAEGTVYLSCGVYKGCSYSPDEMAKVIGDKLSLSGWKYQGELGGVYGQYYCAKGKVGDKICTSKTIDDNGYPRMGVTLLKGALGSSGPDF